ncbi:MAG: hypothetical protein ACRDUW_28220, partial [Pseudonocardiaceae bacterium]
PPHDEVYPTTPLDAAAVDEPWVAGEQWYARSSEERQRVLDRAAAITDYVGRYGFLPDQWAAADVPDDPAADAVELMTAEAIATERWLNDEEACREGENTTTAQDPDTGHAKDCVDCEHVPGAAHCMTEELNEPWRGNTPAEESSGKPTAADAVQRAHHAATELHARDSTNRIEPASRGEPTSVAASEAVSDGNDQRPLVEVVAEARAAVRELANQEPAREPVAAQVHEEFTVGTADAVVLGDE